MGYKTTVEIDGKEHEVEIDGVIAESKVSELYTPKEAVEAEISRRITSAVKNATEGKFGLDDLESDEALKAKVLEKLDLKPGDRKPTDEEIAAAVKKAREDTISDLTAREIDPRKKEIETKDATITGLRRSALHAEIVRAAAALGVKKALLTPPSASASPPIVAMLESVFGYDAENDGWFVREGDGYRVAPDPTKERLHMNIEEFVRGWVEDKTNAEFVDAQRQGGPGLGDGDKGGPGVTSGKDVWLTPDEAQDHATYAAAKKKAEEQGGLVRTKGFENVG